MCAKTLIFKGEEYTEYVNEIQTYACEDEEQCRFSVEVADLADEGYTQTGVESCPYCGSDITETTVYAGVDCAECGTYLDVESLVYESSRGRCVCPGCMPA